MPLNAARVTADILAGCCATWILPQEQHKEGTADRRLSSAMQCNAIMQRNAKLYYLQGGL